VQDSEVISKFANQFANCDFLRLKEELCPQNKIPISLRGTNFDGVLCFRKNETPKYFPIEHTRATQDTSDPVMGKIFNQQPVKPQKKISVSNDGIFAGVHRAVQNKHENFTGYSKWASHLREHKLDCSEKGILLIEKFDNTRSGLYGPGEFGSEIDLLKDSCTLEPDSGLPNFFSCIYYCAWGYTEFGKPLELWSDRIWGKPPEEMTSRSLVS
jgi:hypothetical protein